MNFKKDALIIISAYLLAISFIIVFDKIFVTVLFISALMLFHFLGFRGERDKLNKTNKDSVARLLSKLNKTKKENDDSYKRFVSLTKTLGSGLIMVNE